MFIGAWVWVELVVREAEVSRDVFDFEEVGHVLSCLGSVFYQEVSFVSMAGNFEESNVEVVLDCSHYNIDVGAYSYAFNPYHPALDGWRI